MDRGLPLSRRRRQNGKAPPTVKQGPRPGPPIIDKPHCKRATASPTSKPPTASTNASTGPWRSGPKPAPATQRELFSHGPSRLAPVRNKQRDWHGSTCPELIDTGKHCDKCLTPKICVFHSQCSFTNEDFSQAVNVRSNGKSPRFCRPTKPYIGHRRGPFGADTIV